MALLFICNGHTAQTQNIINEMGEWLIYGSNGTQKATVKKLEYSGEFMGETSVTCDIYSPSPISFSIGDYLVYRGERFTIDYDATRLKQARNNTYGKGYTYENMRFLSYVGELKKCEFLDFVPSDNLIHFSQLPDFSFYAETVKDLADRLQANLDRIYTGSKAWSVQVVQGFEGKENVNVSVSKATCFDALRMAYDQFEATFIIRGRTITIGTAGNELETDFTYGKGNGLKTIERSVDESDSLVTRLRAYGNTTNLPANYYKNIGMRVYAPIYEIYHVSTTGCDIHFVPKLKNACFNDKNGQYSYWVTVSLDETLWLKAVASPNNHLSSTNYSVVTVGLYGSNTQAQITQFLNQLQSGTYEKLYFKEGINVGAWPVEYREYAENVPNLMAIDRLMLPGFPELTTDPYIDASNISTLGVREKSVYFDGSDPDTPDIHPTLEGMTAAELRAAGYTIDLDAGDNGNLDEIAADATETDGSPITADGAFEGVDEVPGFKVTIKDIGFDINDYLSTETATLVMKTGMCGGREFTIVNVEKVGNKYVLECQRTEDVSHYFPYNPYLIKAGDKFVLTNIEMPKAYIDAASQRLLAAAQAYIAKYSAPQWVYAIKMDDIWMQRQKDNSVSEASSYYWNIKEGDVMNVTDSDLGVDISEVIDRLTIREGYGPIPEFEVVLRKEKPQGTIGVLQNRIRQLELRNAEQVDIIRRQQNYLTFIFGDTLADVMSQLDKKAETWYQANDPSSAWTNDEDKAEHVGDLWMDTSANGGKKTYIYQNTGTSDSPNYQWVEQYVPDEVFDEIDGKAEIFIEKPTAYHERDMWIIENGISSSDLPTGCVAGDIVISSTDSTSFNKAHWSKKDRYTDDSSLNTFLNGYTGTLTGIRNDITNAATAASNAQTSANNASTAAAQAKAAADALDYLKQAYLADNTLIDHGLILSTIVALRDSSNNVWSGISGAYDSTKLGNGIAAWYGGGMIDKEVSAVSNAAKSLFRFDGSGYVANGNLKWDANGNVTIQGYSINATTLQVGGSNVATQAMLDNFVSKAFFNRLFTAYDANGNAIVPNDTTTAISNLKIMVGAWTEQYLSALGLNSQGGGGGGTGSVNSIKIASNTYLDPDSDGIIDMSSYAANWNDAYNKRHTHSNKSVLDEITSTKVSNWDAVYGVVPSAAYESGNQLADKNFVNSSISTATATYISNNGVPFNSLAELQAYTGQHDKNDYAFVKTTDSAGNTLYNRYKFDGTSWSLEYTLNNSSFTADQWSAINSGITSSLVSKLNGIAAGAQVNVLESVKINGTALSISSKAVNIVTGNGLQSSSNTISILLPSNSGLSVASTGLKLDIVNDLNTSSAYRAISATQAKKIWDLLNQMFTLEGAGTTASPYVIKANYGLYTEQFLSALGQNSSGGGGGDFDEEQMWAALQSTSGTYGNEKIATSHIPDMASTYGYLKSSALSGYATQSWVNQQGFLTTHQTIYALTLKAGGTAVTTFTPNSADASLDFVAGTNISLTRGTNQITIANTYSYTLPLAASGTRGGVQIGYSESNSGTSTTRNYAVKLSSEKMYVNVPWTDTTYKLTLNGTTNGASGGTSLGSFYAPTASGTANQVLISGGSNTAPSWTAQSNLSVGTAAKLGTGTTTYSAWGQTYWSSGVPQSISGNMTSVGSITPSANGNALGTTSARFNIYGTAGNFSGNVSISGTLGVTGATTLSSTLSVASGITLTTTKKIYFGDTDHYLELDSTGFHFSHGVYSDSFVSALGANSSGGGGGGGIDIEAMWAELQGNTGTYENAKINWNHIPLATSTTAGAIKVGSTLAISNGILNQKSGIATAGTYRSVTVDTYGRVTAGTNPTTLSGYGISDAYTKTQVDNALGGYLTRKAYSLDGKTAVRITFNSVNGGIISARVTKQSGSLVLIGNGYGDGGTTRNNWVQISESTAYFSWCIPTATGIEKSVEIYNNYTTTASIVVASFDTNVTFTELSALSTTASNVKVAYASSLDDYLPLSGGTLTGSLKVATGYGISDATGNGLLVFKPATTWGGISSTQWGVGAGDVQGVIRSGNYNLLHYNSGTGTSSTILDTNNSNVVNGVGFINGTAITAISGNAGTATTLATSRSIWGQSFNGSADIKGTLFLQSDVDGATINSDSAKLKFNSSTLDGTNIYRSPYIQALGGSSYGRKRLGFFQSNATNYTDDFVEAMSILPTGNVGIGNTSPAYKLDVSGQGHFIHSTYDVLQLTRTGGAYSTGIAFNNSSDGLLGGLMVQGSATSYSDDYNGVGTLRFKPVGGSSDFAVMHNGLTKFITATASGRYAELQNSGWLIHHITVNDSFSVAYCTYDSSGNNIGSICGCFGQNQTITNYFIGGTWNAPLVRIVRSNGNMGIGLGNTNPSYKLHVSGAIYGTGEITAASDERKKNIISNTKFNVKDIASARSIIYEWNDGRDKDNEKKIHGGSIAQDWIGKADSFLSQDNDGFYSINYGALALCSAITIAKEVVKHEDRISKLERENAYLKNRVRELERRIA